MTEQELINALTKINFVKIRQKGSHVRMKHEDGRIVTSPVHSGRMNKKGLLKQRLKDADLNMAELIELLS